MSTNGTRSQGSVAIVIADDDAEVIDGTPNWEGPFIEYDRYDGPAGHSYVRYPVCEVEVLDGEASAASHRPVHRYE